MCCSESRVVRKMSPTFGELFLMTFNRLELVSIFLKDAYWQCGKHHKVSKNQKIMKNVLFKIYPIMSST